MDPRQPPAGPVAQRAPGGGSLTPAQDAAAKRLLAQALPENWTF